MNELMKIGEFAKLLNTTTKTLRYYEEIGIFKPVYKDPLTSYRYYHRHQLKEGYTLISLKESGIPIRQIEDFYDSIKYKELLLEGSSKLEREIERLTKLKESLDKKIVNLEKINSYEEEIQIEIISLDERRYLIYEFHPINVIDGADIYKRALEFEKIISEYKIPFIFKGALLSIEALTQNKFLLNSLIFQVDKNTNIKNTSLYLSPKGKYLSIKYKGYPKEKNKNVMTIINKYINDHSITPVNEVIGFSHTGAHTNSHHKEYWSEIRVRIE